MIFFVVSTIKSRLKADERKIKLKFQKDKHFAELIKGSGVAFVLRILGIICGYIFTLLVTRTLGAEAWGIFSLCLVVLQISSVVGRLGMDTALLRFTAEYTAKREIGTLKEIYKKALTLVIPFSIFVAVSVYLLSPTLSAKVFHKPYLTSYFKIISLAIVPFVLLWIHSESIRGLKKIKEYMLLQQTGIFLVALLLFLVGLLFIEIKFLPVVSYGISIIILAIISIYLWRKYLIRFLKTLTTPFKTSIASTTSYSTILSVSIPMLLSSSLALIMGWTDTIMLGMFRSAQEVGIYNVALRVSMITSISLMAINTIAAPKFAEFWGRRDIKALGRVAQQSTKLIFWTSFPVLLIFWLFPKYVLAMFGEEFKEAAVALMILTAGQFVNVASGSVMFILQMTNNQSIVFRTIFFSVVINIVLNYSLIRYLGIIGASIATAFSLCLLNVLGVCFVYRKFGFITFWR